MPQSFNCVPTCAINSLVDWSLARNVILPDLWRIFSQKPITVINPGNLSTRYFMTSWDGIGVFSMVPLTLPMVAVRNGNRQCCGAACVPEAARLWGVDPRDRFWSIFRDRNYGKMVGFTEFHWGMGISYISWLLLISDSWVNIIWWTQVQKGDIKKNELMVVRKSNEDRAAHLLDL
jgi:hypothetical protein